MICAWYMMCSLSAVSTAAGGTAAQEAAIPPRPARPEAPAVTWHPEAAAAPVLFLSEVNLDRLRTNLDRGTEPWAEAWIQLKQRADQGLQTAPAPYLGDDFMEMLDAGQEQSDLIYAMALRWRVTGEQPFADAARDMLLAWCTSEPMVGTTPAVTTEASPGRPWGNEPDVGLRFAVLATGMANAYEAIYPHLTEAEVAAVERWFRFLATRVKEGRDHWIENEYYGHQYYNNHLSLQNMAGAALGFALRDPELIDWVFNGGEADYFDMLSGAIFMPGESPAHVWHRDPSRDVRAGEIFDRYRITSIKRGKGQGINYSFLNLRGLTLATEMAYNNGIDLYDHRGPHGESLVIAYRQLAPYLITFDPALHGPYHANDDIGAFQADMYEILYRRAGDGEGDLFRRVLMKANRVQDMPYVLGFSSVLLYGEPLTREDLQRR